MNVRQGDRVWVNLAPFIGSVVRSEQSIPCEVLTADAQRAYVRTEPPHRVLSLWVETHWLERQVAPRERSLAAAHAD